MLMSPKYSVANNFIFESFAVSVDADKVSSVTQRAFTVDWFERTVKFGETVRQLFDGNLPDLLNKNGSVN